MALFYYKHFAPTELGGFGRVIFYQNFAPTELGGLRGGTSELTQGDGRKLAPELELRTNKGNLRRIKENIGII